MKTPQQLLGEMWNDIQQAQMEAEERAARAEPLAHRLSRVMERGKPLNYRWWGVPGRGRHTRYCYATHRNVAGFFLTWREVEVKDRVTRDQWAARRVKQRCIEIARRRAEAHRARLKKD